MKTRLLIPIICIMCMISGAVPAYAAYYPGVGAFAYNGYSIPAYDGDTYEIVNSGNPKFSAEEIQSDVFESYGELDSKGRCTSCEAHLDKSLMPTYERGSIYEVKPTGWQSVTYSNVPGRYLYNRCHLIGFQLTGVDCENAKSAYAPNNLITGTRQLNVGNGSTGMIKFENMVADYVRSGGEVLYRVTPVFRGEDNIAKGVLMEGRSVKSKTATSDIKFCVFCYNVQPGISIDYSNGASRLTETQPPAVKKPATVTMISAKANNRCYITKTGRKYHVRKSCVQRPITTTITYAKKNRYGACRKCGKARWIITKYKKASNATGYQIAYRKATAKNYIKKNTTSLSCKISGLSRSTTYYIKVRAYNGSGADRVYGKYSTLRKVKTN